MAEADLPGAAAKAPHWPDTVKALGDVLLREGPFNEAAARRDQALKDAPAWAALRQAREATARRAG